MAKKAFNYPARTFNRRKLDVAAVLWTLHLHGPFESPSGQAAAALHEHVKTNGIHFAPSTLSAILTDLDGGAYGQLIERDIRGKRTFGIKLLIDPDIDPFPRNPFPSSRRPTVKPTKRPTVKPTNTEPAEAEIVETFTRQALHDANGQFPQQLTPVEPEFIEPEVIEPEPTLELPNESPVVEPAVEPPHDSAPARIDFEVLEGDSDPVFEIPSPVSSATSLLTSAIQCITQALVLQIEEDTSRRNAELDDRVDQRLAAYVALIERNAHLEARLKESMGRERELIALVRTHQATIDALQGQRVTM